MEAVHFATISSGQVLHSSQSTKKAMYFSMYIPTLKMSIYIYIYRFAELDYLVEDIYCYSEFHAPQGA